jgi:hypothetical protein
MPKKLSKDWVSTSELAAILDCSIDLIYKLRDEQLFKKNEHWRVLNPTAARPTYRWHRNKCQNTLDNYQVKQ